MRKTVAIATLLSGLAGALYIFVTTAGLESNAQDRTIKGNNNFGNILGDIVGDGNNISISPESQKDHRSIIAELGYYWTPQQLRYAIEIGDYKATDAFLKAGMKLSEIEKCLLLTRLIISEQNQETIDLVVDQGVLDDSISCDRHHDDWEKETNGIIMSVIAASDVFTGKLRKIEYFSNKGFSSKEASRESKNLLQIYHQAYEVLTSGNYASPEICERMKKGEEIFVYAARFLKFHHFQRCDYTTIPDSGIKKLQKKISFLEDLQKII